MSGETEIGRFGPHVITFEEPDLIVSRIRAEASPAEIIAMSQAVKKFTEGRPYVLMLGELTETNSGTSSPEVRKLSAEQIKQIPYRGMAYFGLSFQMRVAANLLMGAIRLLNKTDNPTEFFKTEAEARVWLAKRRQQIAAER